MGIAKEEKAAGVGRGGQRSNARCDDSGTRGSCWNCGKEGHRIGDRTTKWKSGPPGGQQQAIAQSGGATLSSGSLSSKVLSKAPHEQKRCTAERAFLYAHAWRFLE